MNDVQEANKNKDCLFCKMTRKEIPIKKIYEDEKYLAFLDKSPMHEGHTLLIPKKHEDYIFDLEDEEYCQLMLTAKKISKVLKKAINKEKVGLAVEGFLVRHVHVHLVPINQGEGIDPCLQKTVSNEELDATLNKINNIQK